MGEAKRRKDNDRLYGVYPKSGRGIILAPPVTVSGTGFSTLGDSREELRRAALFWDKISLPTNNLIRVDGGADADFLKQVGILEQPVFRFPSGNSDVFSRTQFEAFRQYEINEPGKWQLEQVRTDSEQLNHTSMFSSGRGVLLKLSRAIPIPVGETPLEEVLNFREKNIDEIRELMIYLDHSYEKIISSIDRELALVSEIGSIESRCAAVIRVAKESKVRFKLGDIGFGFSLGVGSLTQLPIYASYGALIGSGYGMQTLGALLGGALPFLSLKTGLGLKGRQNTENPFRVVGRIHNEMISF